MPYQPSPWEVRMNQLEILNESGSHLCWIFVKNTCLLFHRSHYRVVDIKRLFWQQECRKYSRNIFLDTQVSLAPTHVSWLVGWLVRPLVGPSHFRISNLWSVTVDQIKKFKKQSPSIFEFCFWKEPPHPQKCI